ncbi:exported hypothetical protein [Frankia sp. AiPs1]
MRSEVIIAAVLAAVATLITSVLVTVLSHESDAAPHPQPSPVSTSTPTPLVVLVPTPAAPVETQTPSSEAPSSCAGDDCLNASNAVPSDSAIRRAGTINIPPGIYVNLDSTAPNWDVSDQFSPTGGDDIGNRDSSLVIGSSTRIARPLDRSGAFDSCSRATEYVLQASTSIGSSYCVKTSGHRYGLVTVENKSKVGSEGDLITVKVKVWSYVDQAEAEKKSSDNKITVIVVVVLAVGFLVAMFSGPSDDSRNYDRSNRRPPRRYYDDRPYRTRTPNRRRSEW